MEATHAINNSIRLLNREENIKLRVENNLLKSEIEDLKMNQTPLTNMEGYKVDCTPESYDALIELGYIDTVIDKETRLSIYNPISLFVEHTGIINSSIDPKLDKKQAYYHKGHFYDQPYEEFTITEDKVQFPELKYDDNYIPIIKTSSAMFEIDKEDFDSLYEWALNLENEKSWLYIQQLDKAKKEIFLKSIDRRLHKNRPLALAIGRWLDESRTTCIDLADGTFLQYVSSTGKYFMVYPCSGTNVELYDVSSCTLPYDYIIPDQVLQLMKEYQEQGIK